IIWRDELNEGRILLRDIIDLDATYAGPDAKAVPMTAAEGDSSEAGQEGTQAKAASANGAAEEESEAELDVDEDDEDDDPENNMSLAAMEAELKPQVVATFDRVASEYKKLRRLQDQLVENKLRNSSLSPSQERRYKKLRAEIVEDVKSLSLNNNRLQALVAQLYHINKRLTGSE